MLDAINHINEEEFQDLWQNPEEYWARITSVWNTPYRHADKKSHR